MDFDESADAGRVQCGGHGSLYSMGKVRCLLRPCHEDDDQSHSEHRDYANEPHDGVIQAFDGFTETGDFAHGNPFVSRMGSFLLLKCPFLVE